MSKVKSKKTIGRAYILMFVSPPLAVLSSFKSMSINQRRWLLIIAGTVLGSTFLFDDIGDGIRHYEMVQTYYSNITYLEFIDVTWKILTLQATEIVRGDLYIHVVSFISGGILSFPPFFWTIVSFVYSYFYISSAFKIYYWYPNVNTTYLFIFFFALFVAFKSFEGINTVRTWTGMWVLFYGIISYCQTKQKKYLLLIFLCPPLIHFGYLALAVPVWIAFLLNTDKGLIKTGIILVFFFSFFGTINQAQVLDIATQSELGEGRTQSYYVEDAGNRPLLRLERLGTSNFYKAIHESQLNFFFILCISFTMIIYGNYFRQFNSIEAKLFSIGIVMQSYSNVTAFLYALSNRSAFIAIIFITASITLYLSRTYYGKSNHSLYSGQRFLILLFATFLLTFFLFKTAEIIQWMSAYFVGLPIVPILYEDANMTVRQFLGPVFEPLFN